MKTFLPPWEKKSGCLVPMITGAELFEIAFRNWKKSYSLYKKK
jgi:hypothetical protein